MLAMLAMTSMGMRSLSSCVTAQSTMASSSSLLRVWFDLVWFVACLFWFGLVWLSLGWFGWFLVVCAGSGSDVFVLVDDSELER